MMAHIVLDCFVAIWQFNGQRK